MTLPAPPDGPGARLVARARGRVRLPSMTMDEATRRKTVYGLCRDQRRAAGYGMNLLRRRCLSSGASVAAFVYGDGFLAGTLAARPASTYYTRVTMRSHAAHDRTVQHGLPPVNSKSSDKPLRTNCSKSRRATRANHKLVVAVWRLAVASQNTNSAASRARRCCRRRDAGGLGSALRERAHGDGRA